MAGTLREELASLKIDRPDPMRLPAQRACSELGGRAAGAAGPMRVLSWLLWMIPVGVLAAPGVYGFRQYDQVRSRIEVSKGIVASKTWAEASTLLDADGYLKSRFPGDDRDEDCRPRREDVRRRGQQGQERRYPRCHRAHGDEGDASLA